MPQVILPGYIWFPPDNHPNWKIEVIRSDGTIDNVTNFIYESSLTWGATEIVGNFSITIDNFDEAYSNIYAGGETIYFYIDYANATTKYFTGIVEKVGYEKDPVGKVILSGRHAAVKLLSVTVTQQYTDQETSVILKDLFDKYATGFTYNNVQTSTTNMTVNWNQKGFWEAVTELCSSAGFDVYVDADLDCHYFPEKSIQNITDAVVHDDNLISVSGFGNDIADVANRIIVYGQDIGGLPLIASAEDDASQSSLYVKESIVNDTNITTMDQAQERADYELAKAKNAVEKGEVTSNPGLPTIKPGEMIFISDPSNNLITYYKIITFTHDISEEGMSTKITIEREPISIAKVFKERITTEQDLSNITNPYEMRYSYNFTFDDNSQVEVHAGTKTQDGHLLLDSGYSTGTMTSKAKTAADNITYVQVKASGSNIVGTQYQISVNNGVSWETVTSDEKHTLGHVGKKLKSRVIINATGTQVDSFAVLYR